MPNLGNAWHIPGNPEPRSLSAMRSPIGTLVPGVDITICSGNQFQGGGNPGNQLGVGSALLFKRTADAAWRSQPLVFLSAADNNKYFAATIAAGTFQVGESVQYYLRIPYDDHDTTFIHQDNTGSATTDTEAIAQAAPFTFAVEDSAAKGQWGPVFGLPNVGIHAHLLPSGRVLLWGRRDNPGDTLDAHVCTPFVWNPADGSVLSTNQPARATGETVNLFCSGHSFLPDGRLLVVGGHWFDGDGLNQACLYDYRTNTWSPTRPMVDPRDNTDVRRWYPTATTLPNGKVLVFSGAWRDASGAGHLAELLQVWNNDNWETISKADGTPLDFGTPPLYPRMAVTADGRVFMSGSNAGTQLLKTSAPGEWDFVGSRQLGLRDYCPAVQYDTNKIVYIGGGNDGDTKIPTAGVELIDLSAAQPQWQLTTPMRNPRRQHNATALPDGTVLVTGGTRGGGGPNAGFNDLGPGMPVHMAEVWDPSAGTWTELTAEAVPRCYHATALLLPDGTVLSAGGGEYRPDNVNDNDPADSHRDAQRFSPPYLFKGARPTIAAAPPAVDYGAQFLVTTPEAAEIRKVTLIRLASVTHSFDQNQRIAFLSFTTQAAGLTVTAPASPNECPPGFYMLFLLNQAGVPSVASMLQIRATAIALPAAFTAAAVPAATPERLALDATASAPAARPRASLRVYDQAAQIERDAKGTAVLIGITGTCPYGIAACWGGAHEALGRLEAVAAVYPFPDTDDSTARVFLRDSRLPPLDLWRVQFRQIVNGSYEMRGVEVTLEGALELRADALFLGATADRPAVRLAALTPSDKLQWNHNARAVKPLEPSEAGAYARLRSDWSRAAQRSATVTGPLQLAEGVYTLLVRRGALRS